MGAPYTEVRLIYGEILVVTSFLFYSHGIIVSLSRKCIRSLHIFIFFILTNSFILTECQLVDFLLFLFQVLQPVNTKYTLITV